MKADEFIALLRPSHSLWADETWTGDRSQWVFRGHRDARWRLKPRAWRDEISGNPLFPLIKKLESAPLNSENNVPPGSPLHRALAWTHAERVALNEFRRVSWRLGFEVQEPAHANMLTLDFGCYSISDTRDDPESYSPFHSSKDIGVAQHYGIPTRFLDWTFNPLVAIFFAQDDSISCPEDTNLCVWALDMYAINGMLKWENKTGRPLMYPIIPIRRGNEFIAAQDGVLLEVEHKWSLDFFERRNSWPSIEEVVEELNGEPEFSEEYDEDYYIYDQEHPVLRRIVLPASEIAPLRRMLEKEGLTREKLMPALENAARATLRAIARLK